MIREVEYAELVRQLNDAKETIAELTENNTNLRNQLTKLQARMSLDHEKARSVRLQQDALTETINREREAAKLQAKTDLNNQLRQMEGLQQENDKLKRMNKLLKEDLDTADQKLMTYTNIDPSGRLDATKNMKEISRLHEKIKELTKRVNDQSAEAKGIREENLLLRQLSKVPDNFGEMLDKFKDEQTQNALYYKRKNEYMEQEIKKLEEENVRYKTELRKYAGMLAKLDGKTHTFEFDDEQRKFIDECVMNAMRRDFEIPKTDNTIQLQEEVKRLKIILAEYEKITQYNQMGGDTQGGNRFGGTGQMDEQQYNTLLEAIANQKKDMENLFASYRNEGFPNTAGNTQNNFHPGPDQDASIRNTINNANRPPRPIAGIFGDWTEVNEGISYKFGTRLQVKPYDEELTGMDIDKAKYYISVLQLHNLESMELLAQREQEHQLVLSELEDLRSGLKKALLLQDKLFVNHHHELAKFDSQTRSLKDENRELRTQNEIVSKKVEIFEQSLSEIQSKHPGAIEARLAETTKLAAIAETNIIKLSRKYDALEAENKDTIRAWKIVDIDQNEREYHVMEKMNKLLEWKEDATQKIKILMERVKESAPIADFNKIKIDLEMERQKNCMLKSNENFITMQTSKLNSLEREKYEEVDRAKKLEDDIASLETELSVVELRLSALDPTYHRFTLIFKKIANVLKNNNISPLQYFQAMDTDKSGTLSASEFYKALESMGIPLNPDERDHFFSLMDLDNSGILDYTEFARKLKRMGVMVRSKEEEIVTTLMDAITRANMTLDHAYSMFDSNKNNSVSFNEMVTVMKDIGIDVDPRSMSEFFKLVDINDNGTISRTEFIYVFKRFNKINSVTGITPDTTLDWKLDMMSRLEKMLRQKDIPPKAFFDEIDGDQDGRVNYSEFKEMFIKKGLRIEEKEFKKLFLAIDNNNSGHITSMEFINYMNTATAASQKLQKMKLYDQKFKANSSMNNESIIMDGEGAGYDTQTRYQLKIAQIEAKEKSAKRHIGEYMKRINAMEDEKLAYQKTIDGLESQTSKLQQELIKAKDRSSKLDKLCQSTISKEKAEVIKAQNANLRIENTQLRGALNTFRSLHEAAVREAKTLKVAVGRNDDENDHLRKEIREMQSESDEKVLIGKLFNQVLTEKWVEAGFNKKYDQILDDLRKTQIENSNMTVQIKKKDDENFEMQNAASEKINILEKQLFEANMQNLSTVSLSKLEELNLALKRLANQKLELEVANKKLRTESYENQVKLDSYLLREESLRETEEILKERNPDDLSQKIIELTNRLSQYKLNELKAQREASLIKEREEYFMRVNKNQAAQIDELEKQVVENEGKMAERENFWRGRFHDQLNLLNKAQPSSMQNHPSSTDVNRIVNEDMKKGNTAEDQLMRSPTSPSKIMGNSTLYGSKTDVDNVILRDKIKVLEDLIRGKDAKIQKLQSDIENRPHGINYRTEGVDTLVVNDLETKARDIAAAAQQTVKTLQEMLADKDRIIMEKEKKIDDLRNDVTDKGRQLSRAELEVESLKRQLSVGDSHRMNVEQYTALRTMEKISNMDRRDMEKMMASYDNNLNILTSKLNEVERENSDLKDKLAATNLEKNQIANNNTLEANLTELEKLKKANHSISEMYKKKCLEIKRQNDLLKKYVSDFEAQDKEILKLKVEQGTKSQVTKNETGHYEEKIAVLTSKFTAVKEEQKNDKKVMQEMRTNEIRYREKISELNEKVNTLTAANTKLKDDNSMLQGKRLANTPIPVVVGGNGDPNQPPIPIVKSSGYGRRPSSASKRPGQTPNSQTNLPQLGPKNSAREDPTNKLKEEVNKLQSENLELRMRVAAAPGAADFVDEDGYLYTKDAMAFRSKEEMLMVLRKYLNYLGPSTNIFEIMKRADLKKTGTVPVDQLLSELQSAGIKFKDRDRSLIYDYLPRETNGNVNYKEFYYMIKGGLKDSSVSVSTTAGTPGKNTAGGSFIGSKSLAAAGVKEGRNNTHAAIIDKNVDLLKKKLNEKDKEVVELTRQLKTWKQTALKHEQELNEKNNTARNPSYGMNSALESRLSRKGEALKQIQDLEEQIRTLKKELKYEIDKREQVIKELQEDLARRNYELSISQSEGVNLRSQLEKVLNGKLQKDLLLEERDKEKEILVASLMERLEKSRKLEEEIRNKLRAVERENIDLKHIKEGIDNRLESLNREIRELKEKKKYE